MQHDPERIAELRRCATRRLDRGTSIGSKAIQTTRSRRRTPHTSPGSRGVTWWPRTGLCAGDVSQQKFERDSDFIAAVRTALPEALDEIERLRAMTGDAAA